MNSSSNNPFNVRVTRSTDGLWDIRVDQGVTGNFQSLGLVTDNTFNSTVAFGIKILQSGAAGPVNSHWFDNFNVAPIPPDVTPPTVINVEALSATQALLTFDEPLDAATAGNAANYSVNGGIGNPSSAQFNTETLLNVTLTFAQALNEGQVYTLTVNDVEDLAGNAISSQALELVFFTIAQSAFREIVFNEMMVDENPPVALPAAEFIELYNTTTDKYFDLSGYTYVNGTTANLLGTALLAPDSYLILCRSADAQTFEAYGDVLALPSWPALTNSADSLTLLNPEGQLIDAVSYTIGWYQDPDKDEGGWTLEQINPFSPCSGMGNWRASDDPQGGTPGEGNSIFDDTPDTTAPEITGFQQVSSDVVRVFFNEIMDGESLNNGSYSITPGVNVVGITAAANLMSVDLQLDTPLEVGETYTLLINGPADCSGNVLEANTSIEILFGIQAQLGDVTISEIMADPTPVVGLPAQEYFELFNASDNVIDIQGCELSGLSFNHPRLLMPGEYLLCVSSSAIGDFQNYPDAYVMDGMSLTFLTNGGRELSFINQSGTLVNTVTYDISWYRDPSKTDGGWSLEIINPFTQCSGAQNWRASNAALGGTPGAQNSVFNDAPDLAPPVIQGYYAEAEDIIVLQFNELMDEESLINGSYLMDQGIAVLEAQPLSPLIEVRLLLSESLEVGAEYSLTVNGLLDCSLNAMPEATVSIRLGESPELHDVLISEIMADPTPAVGLPPTEYFELYNASDKVIELQGLTLSGLELTNTRLLLPGEYVICAPASQLQEWILFEGVYFVDGMSTTFLTNGGRELLLQNSAGEQIDIVTYDLTWYRDRSKEDGGWSLERINLEEPCRSGDNWTASVDSRGGTPGEENSVNSTAPDAEPPFVTVAVVLAPTEVEVRFSEVIDLESIATAEFSIDNNSVTSQMAILPNATAALLSLGSPLQAGIIYTLEVSGVRDCVGNSMAGITSVKIALPETAEPGDVVINELLFNVRSGGSEFVEVYNLSEKSIGLQNWIVRNQSGTERIVTADPLVIFPGEYRVFTTDPAWLIENYPLGRAETFLAVNVPSFTNSAGSVILLDAQMTEIDKFDYEEDFHLSLLRSFQGVSLERLSFTRPTNDPGNWTSAAENVGFATPGYQNSQFLPEGQATGQFELENEVFSPDNDGFQDVLLINYNINQPGYVANVQIFDRRGRMVRNLVSNEIIGTQGTISWDGTTDNRSKARIGPHIVYIELFSLDGQTKVYKLPCIVAGRLGG